jgi:hypothetical protein
MPWPASLETLLARPDSPAACALRWGLLGLRASLRAAVEEFPNDPAGQELRGVLGEIDALLTGGGSGEIATELLPQAGAAAAAMPLLPLARAVAADARLAEALQRCPLRTGSDEEIWSDVQRLLLRVPQAVCVEWRRRSLELATKVGAQPIEARSLLLSLGWDELIYPGLSGALDVPELRSLASALPDPRVGSAPDEELSPPAAAVAACTYFAENDPALHHCLAGVFRFGLAALLGEQRERYIAELLRRWHRVRTAPRSSWKERLKDRLDLDEALHSLVYQPPADLESWWGRLLGAARESLFHERDSAAAAGCQVHLQLLSGNFADVNRLAPDSLEVDFGVPGEVAVCLRVWARIDGEELKGRVLYRPPREEA